MKQRELRNANHSFRPAGLKTTPDTLLARGIEQKSLLPPPLSLSLRLTLKQPLSGNSNLLTLLKITLLEDLRMREVKYHQGVPMTLLSLLLGPLSLGASIG